MDTIFDAAGGAVGLIRLAEAWHERVMADEVVSHAFSHGFHPEHSQRLAAYWGEALGGPAIYSDRFGDESAVVRMHSGNGPHDEMDQRAIECFDDAMRDIGVDAPVFSILHDYFAWATTTTMARFHDSVDDVPADLRIPTWSWDGLQTELTDMPAIRSVDAACYSFVIDETLAITQQKRRAGPPERLPGMTLGIIDVEANAPHGGEMHPDGDELLYVISGRLRVVSESDPASPVVLGPGDACIVSRGEWHKVEMIEPAQLLHVTPGPNGDHRPLAKDQTKEPRFTGAEPGTSGHSSVPPPSR